MANMLAELRPLVPMYVHLIVSAIAPIYAGAHASLSRPSSAAKPTKNDSNSTQPDDDDDDPEDEHQMEGLSPRDAIIFPVTAGITLASLYWLIKKYGAKLINAVLGWYFAGVGVISVGKLVNDSVLFALGPAVSQLASYRLELSARNIVQYKSKFHAGHVISAITGATAIAYANNFAEKVWWLTNLQGFAVCYSALQIMSPTTFVTGSLILSGLFFYDIWAVFFTPLMVTVAKSLDQPIKLVFPRPDQPNGMPGGYSMLGLGDIVLPGLMIGLALRFDLYMFYFKKQKNIAKTSTAAETKILEKATYVRSTDRWDRSFPKPYFTASMVGYVTGMVTTLGVMTVFQHAQPALLYLVPGVLVSVWSTALFRGELKSMWDFSEAITSEQIKDEREEKEKAEDGKESKDGQEKKKKAELDKAAVKRDPRGVVFALSVTLLKAGASPDELLPALAKFRSKKEKTT